MIRVAVDATPLLGERTGIGVFVDNALAALARRGEVALVAYAVTWRNRGHLGAVLPPGVTAARAPMAAGPLHAAWRRTGHPVIERWTGAIDVVHGTNCIVPPARRAAEVVTVHDLTCVRYPEMCEPVSLRFPAMIASALSRGAFVHTDSDAVAAEVIEVFGARPERVRAVPLAVDAAALADAAAPPPGRATSPAGPGPYILALGKVEPRKDLPLLVAAFDAVAAHHPEVDLVIAGPSGWGETALDEAIEGARHRRRIRRLGWVPDAERAALLRGATLLAYPSIYEGFGLPPLEAMAMGVPVVTTDAGAIPSVVGEAARVVPVGDRDALAGALTDLLDDPIERARLTDAGRARAAAFSWDRCARGLEALYRDAARSRR